MDPNMNIFEAQKAGVTEPCDECGRPTLVGGEGICYECQCRLHAIGCIDMDNDPWNGPVEPRQPEAYEGYDDRDDGPVEFTESEAGRAALDRWARRNYESEGADDIPF